MPHLPTLFISHGSPMHAVDAGGAGQAWRALADSLPKPRAILIASAHWETALPMLTGAEKLEFLPMSLTLTVIIVFVTVPETIAGFGGLEPYA